MALRAVFIAALASAITVFALQNSAPASIQFLLWRLEAVPLATVILLSVASGIVLVGVPLWFERWRLRVRLRGLETRLATVEGRAREPERPKGSAA